MTRPKSWSVKGVDGGTRDLARAAAQAAGLPIGAWIDGAIGRAARGELPGIAVAGPAGTTPATLAPEHVPSPTVAAGSEPAAETPAPPAAHTPVVHPSEDAPVPAPEPRPAAEEENADAPEPPRAPAGPVGFGADIASRARPLAPPPRPPRRNIAGYAATAIVLLGILAGGFWVFVELSAPDPVPGQREVAARSGQPEPAPAPPATASAPADDAVPPDATAGLPENVRVGLEMAKAGDAKAQHDVGLLHLAGRHLPRDAREAARWFEAAAVQGLAAAQFNLGVLYGSGEGVEQNPQLAFFWFQSAAEQNEPRAQHNLATAYAEGRGVVQSYDLALDWFTKAANAGLAQSQYSLGRLYETGSPEHRPDLAQARVWYEKAAAQGDGDAAERVAAISALATARKPIDRLEPDPSSAVAAPEATDSRPVTRAEILEAQRLLRRLNFDPGPADGLIGSRTREAVRLFQRFAGIETNGEVSRDLLEELRAVAGPVSNVR